MSRSRAILCTVVVVADFSRVLAVLVTTYFLLERLFVLYLTFYFYFHVFTLHVNSSVLLYYEHTVYSALFLENAIVRFRVCQSFFDENHLLTGGNPEVCGVAHILQNTVLW